MRKHDEAPMRTVTHVMHFAANGFDRVCNKRGRMNSTGIQLGTTNPAEVECQRCKKSYLYRRATGFKKEG